MFSQVYSHLHLYLFSLYGLDKKIPSQKNCHVIPEMCDGKRFSHQSLETVFAPYTERKLISKNLRLSDLLPCLRDYVGLTWTHPVNFGS